MTSASSVVEPAAGAGTSVEFPAIAAAAAAVATHERDGESSDSESEMPVPEAASKVQVRTYYSGSISHQCDVSCDRITAEDYVVVRQQTSPVSSRDVGDGDQRLQSTATTSRHEAIRQLLGGNVKNEWLPMPCQIPIYIHSAISG